MIRSSDRLRNILGTVSRITDYSDGVGAGLLQAACYRRQLPPRTRADDEAMSGPKVKTTYWTTNHYTLPAGVSPLRHTIL